MRSWVKGHRLEGAAEQLAQLHGQTAEAITTLVREAITMQTEVALKAFDMGNRALAAEEHVRIDHDILKALWNLHQADETGTYCAFDGYVFPCHEHRIMTGDICTCEGRGIGKPRHDPNCLIHSCLRNEQGIPM